MANLPDIDALGCKWTPDLRAQYYALPTTAQVYTQKYKEWYDGFIKIMDKIKWDQAAETMTLVIDERPADTYQNAFPTALCVIPSKNVQSAPQRTVTLALKRKRFESPQLCWYDDFQIFMKNRVARHLELLNKEVVRFKAVFYRTFMFHASPTMIWMGSDPLIDEGAPIGEGNSAGTTGKTNAYLASQIAAINDQLGTFTLANLRTLSRYLADANIVPMQAGMQKQNMAIDDTFTLMIDNAEYEGLVDDPLVARQTNASIADFNLVNGSFKGKLLGKFNVMPITRGQRIYVNDDGTIEWPSIEEPMLNGPFKGRPRTTDKYRKAQIGIGWIIGDKAYSIIDPGSPPKGWEQMDAKGQAGLMWGGRPILTTNFLTRCEDPDNPGQFITAANTYGDQMKWIYEEKMGIVANTPHNAIPFAYLRRNAAAHGLWPHTA